MLFLIRQNKTKCAFCLVLNPYFVLFVSLKSILFQINFTFCVFWSPFLKWVNTDTLKCTIMWIFRMDWRVLILALGLLENCWACSVYWVTGPAGLCNKKLIYTPGVRCVRFVWCLHLVCVSWSGLFDAFHWCVWVSQVCVMPSSRLCGVSGLCDAFTCCVCGVSGLCDAFHWCVWVS